MSVCRWKTELLGIFERCLKILNIVILFQKGRVKQLLSALQAMLAMKSAVVEPSSSVEPGPSVPSESSTSVLSSPERKRPREPEGMARVKKPRLEQSVRKSIDNTFATIPIRVAEDIDMNEFLNSVKDEIHRKISEELNERNALKFYLNVKTQLSRTTADGDEQITTPYFCSIPKIILHSTDIGERLTLPEKE